MKHRVQPVIMQAILLAAVVTSARAQSQIHERIQEWQARSSRLVNQLSPTSAISAQFGLSGVLRQLWDGGAWMTQSQTTHSYSGVVRQETLDYDWVSVQWMPTHRTTYRPDGLVESVEEWDAAANTYTPSVRYSYEFVYDLVTEQSVPGLIVTQLWNGIAWMSIERTTYTTARDASSGLIVVSGLDEIWDDGWVPVSDYRVEQVIEDVVQTSREWDVDAQQWRFSERTIFPGTTIRNLSERLNQLAEDLVNFGDLTIGLLMFPDYEAEVWSESEDWAPAGRKLTEAYDFGTGKPAIVAYETWFDQWTVSMRQEVTYTTEGRVEKSSLTSYAFGIIQVVEENYTYDDRGVLTEAVNSSRVANDTTPIARFLFSWTELTVGTDDAGDLPISHALNPAYPNPFNPSTTLSYELKDSDRVTISVYDMLGKHVATLFDGAQPAGRYEIVFDATGLPSGLYALRMQTSDASRSRIVTLLK